jgi:polyribonucleotide nucleotidyltransferase
MVCCTYLKLTTKRIETMDGIFKVGDEVRVKLLDVDKQGKLKAFAQSVVTSPRAKQTC